LGIRETTVVELERGWLTFGKGFLLFSFLLEMRDCFTKARLGASI